jgi:hypothetical protein
MPIIYGNLKKLKTASSITLNKSVEITFNGAKYVTEEPEIEYRGKSFGRYRPATLEEPAEFPEIEFDVKSAEAVNGWYRLLDDGDAEDVTDEILISHLNAELSSKAEDLLEESDYDKMSRDFESDRH